MITLRSCEARRILPDWRGAAVWICALALAASSVSRADAQGKRRNSAEDPVKRGEYLVSLMGCNDCHTPWKMGPAGPEPDMSRMLSGHPEQMTMPPAPALAMPWAWAGSASMTAFAGPWGVSFGSNLTPDMETGIGAWDEDLFLRAIRSGKVKGAGRPMLPPMPAVAYAKATDEDLKAIFAYLKSLPAIKNRVPEPTPPAGPPPGR